MKARVFVDGQEGTTGLQIHERLARRHDISLLRIDPDKRKDTAERARLLNDADIVFLCLPDDAARESVALVTNPSTRIIDASTAHRVAPGWVYGLPELSAVHRETVAKAWRVSNPGCHATGFISIMAPLVAAGAVPRDFPVSCQSLTGYSGAGKKAIAQYEQVPSAENAKELATLKGMRPYALGLSHKHLPEMQAHSGLLAAPIFQPVIGAYSQGMIVSVPFSSRLLPGLDARRLHEVLAAHYRGSRFITVQPLEGAEQADGGFLDPQGRNDTNQLDIFVFGHDDQSIVSARFDNLGKGASGAAVQNMNLMIGAKEDAGL
jgi:N-acetyl-gamma-glutamyl-phosphate reductase